MNKEENIIGLFLNEPSKYWHFEELLHAAHISRPQAVLWLQKLMKENIIHKIKPKKKMPHYVADVNNPSYRIKKKLFALSQLEKTGFLSHLARLPKAKAVILFGSLSRWDWHKESDIDIFIYGDTEGFDYGKYRRLLHREIQILTCKDASELSNFSKGLLRNIFEGYRIKGFLEVEVKVHA